MKDIFAFRYEDFALEGYEPHPHIKAAGGGVSAAPPRHIAIVLLAAVADNGVIGRDNALPWRQSSDLKRFKAITMGKPVVMGRKTYLSIGKPLPGRTNIVVSRDPGFAPEGVVVARSIDAALSAARDDAQQRGADEIVVIGGTDIFMQTMPLADRMEITHVHATAGGRYVFSADRCDTMARRGAQRPSSRAARRGCLQLRHLRAGLNFEIMGKMCPASTLPHRGGARCKARTAPI